MKKKFLLFIAFTFVAIYSMAANINTDVSEVVFDNVLKGESETQYFSAFCVGLVHVIINDPNFFVTIDDSGPWPYSYYWYDYTNDELVLKTDYLMYYRFAVTYKPTSVGSHTATITLKEYDPAFTWGYSPETKTINLKGSAIAPYISTSSSMSFSNKTVGKSYTAALRIQGRVTGNLNLKLTGSSAFKINKTTITKSEASSGASVTVTYSPTGAGSHSATITISGGGLSSNKTVSLKGNAVNRIISTSATSLSFGTIAKGKTSTKTFTVKGTNLTGPLYLTPSGATEMYTITPSTITASQAASGATVKVTYKPTATGTHNAKITISGGDALASKTVSLTGACGTPVIKTSKSTITFCESGSNSFVVTGTYLTGNLTLTMSGSNIFTLSKTSITAAQAANGVTVGVLCIPKNVQRATAKITISGGGASSKTVNLSFSQNQIVQINSVQPEGENEDGSGEFTNGGLLDVFESFSTDVNELAMDIKIYAEGQNIIIESLAEESAIISDISGRARSVNLQAGRNEIPVNASGIYIVRIREKTTKLMLK